MSTTFTEALRQAAPYINAHRDRVCVVYLPGEAMASDGFRELIWDLALGHSLGLKLVLVPGTRPQIDERLAAKNIVSQRVGNYRVTDADSLTCVKDAVGNVRSELEALLSSGLARTPMGGSRIRVASGNLVTAKPVGILNGVDLQYTGSIRRLDVETINEHLDRKRIVILPPLGYSPTGECFNLHSEDVALAAAQALDAEKMVLVTSDDVAVGEWSVKEQPESLSSTESFALKASDAGVERVHLISSSKDGAFISELYTSAGGGTMVSQERYDVLRQAGINDAGGLLRLIEPLEQQGILVPRSREQLELEIKRFAVMARDDMIIGCRALFPYPDQRCAELACVTVHPEYQHGSRASRLLEHAENEAHSLGLEWIFVLTTHAAHWFLERGFVTGSLDDLPQQRQEFYNYQRNSQVLIKQLGNAG